MRPTVDALRSVPSRKLGFQPSLQAPERINASPSATRRETPSISARAKSAVLSVSTPGVWPTAMPRATAACTSMWSTPTDTVDITRSLEAFAKRPSSMLQVSVVRRPSAVSNHSANMPLGIGSSLSQHTSSACCDSRFLAGEGIGNVTTTFILAQLQTSKLACGGE